MSRKAEITQRVLSFMGGSVLVTPTHVEFVFREEDLREADDNPAYRVLIVPESEREELGKFLLGKGGEA